MDQGLAIIARIRTDFPSKFGIPRQSGLVEALQGAVVFEPKYRDVNALRGLADFSHIWLIWQFSEAVRAEWSPTVKPPRLGGNTRLGVFATRSPFRPNPLGLSCVRLIGIDPDTPEGPVLRVAGADLMDGTPIYDIKPYIPYADCHPDATAGFTGQVEFPRWRWRSRMRFWSRSPRRSARPSRGSLNRIRALATGARMTVAASASPSPGSTCASP